MSREDGAERREQTKIAVLEVQVGSILASVDEIKVTQKEIQASVHVQENNSHAHAIESERYRVLLDEIVEEKRTKRKRTEAFIDKFSSRSVLGAVALILLLAWAGLKGKLGG